MKKTIVSAMALISLSVAASAAVAPSSIKGITVSDSENCSDGYMLISERSESSKTVCYDSCLSNGIVVLPEGVSSCGSGDESEMSSGDTSIKEANLGETVFINELNRDVYFPAGYASPAVTAENSCDGNGFDDNYAASSNIECRFESFSFKLEEGYLNLTVASGDIKLDGNFYLTEVDNLANLTEVYGSLDLGYGNLADISGLKNLTKVTGSLNIGSNNTTDWIKDLSPLNNLAELGGTIYLANFNDNTAEVGYDVKLSADSYLCQNFDTKFANAGTLDKSKICY